MPALITDDDFACRAYQYPKDYLGDPDNTICPQLQKPRWMQFRNEKISVNSFQLANSDLSRIHSLGIMLTAAGNERNAQRGKNTINIYKGTRKVSVRNLRSVSNLHYSIDIINDALPNEEHCNVVRIRKDIPADTSQAAIDTSKSDIVVRLFDVFEGSEDLPSP